jgi:hypothetical protein
MIHVKEAGYIEQTTIANILVNDSNIDRKDLEKIFVR